MGIVTQYNPPVTAEAIGPLPGGCRMTCRQFVASAIFWLLPGLFVAAFAAAEFTGRVVRIADGDTVTVLTTDQQQVKVRLSQIDAPERSQPFGNRSRQSLAALVFDKTVRVVIEDTDRYGRTVGRLHADNLDINAEQVRRGMAWVYRQYSDDPALLELEQQARNARRGLWKDPSPIPPWQYRRKPTPAEAATYSPGNTDTAGCEPRRHCSDMRTCEEAQDWLQRCGSESLDGDGDGIACESLCRNQHNP